VSYFAFLAQLVEQRFRNSQVVSSSLMEGSMIMWLSGMFGGLVLGAGLMWLGVPFGYIAIPAIVAMCIAVYWQ
jgi:hypothetical protein